MRTIRSGLTVAAAVGLSVAACAPAAPDPSIASDSTERTASVAVGAAPGLEVLASFALHYLLHGQGAETKQHVVADWYFVDAVFAPYAYDGRQYPPEDTRGWVEREEPLTLRARDELERLGFTVCEVGVKRTPCEDLLTSGERYFALIGIGETTRVSESRWSFDFGFVKVAPWGVSTGGARVAIRTEEGSWSLTDARTLWVDH